MPLIRRLAHVTHVLLALSGCAVCALLILAGGGHPPPIIFLPLVLAVWWVGHLAIWGAMRLLAQGRTPAASAQDLPPPVFPTPRGPLLLVTAAGLLHLLAQTLGTLWQGAWYPYRHPGLWTQMWVFGLLHGAGFGGLLLRRRWARALGLLLAVVWCAVIVGQISRPILHADFREPGSLALALGTLLLALWLGLRLLRDPRIKDYLTR